jgi:hypothetical protein
MHLPFLGRRNPRPRKVTPCLEVLEDRFMPTLFIPIPHGPPTPPRTGGEAVQTGSVLTVDLRNKVGQPGLDTITIVDDGAGDVQVSWDGGRVHSFTGIGQVLVNAAPTVTEVANFQLTGELTVPLNVQLNLSGINNTVTEQVGNNGVVPSGLAFDLVTLRPNGTTQVTVTA